MIIFTNVRKSIDYKDFITQNVHPAYFPFFLSNVTNHFWQHYPKQPALANKKADLVHKDDWHIIEPRRVIFSKSKSAFLLTSFVLERKTRLELATPTLARLCSTNWAISAYFPNGIAKVRTFLKLPNFSAKIFTKNAKNLKKRIFCYLCMLC